MTTQKTDNNFIRILKPFGEANTSARMQNISGDFVGIVRHFDHSYSVQQHFDEASMPSFKHSFNAKSQNPRVLDDHHSFTQTDQGILQAKLFVNEPNNLPCRSGIVRYFAPTTSHFQVNDSTINHFTLKHSFGTKRHDLELQPKLYKNDQCISQANFFANDPNTSAKTRRSGFGIVRDSDDKFQEHGHIDDF